jgi:hypothetical protein
LQTISAADDINSVTPKSKRVKKENCKNNYSRRKEKFGCSHAAPRELETKKRRAMLGDHQFPFDCRDLFRRGSITKASKATAATAAPTTPSPISGPGAATGTAIADVETAQTMLLRVSARKNDITGNFPLI